MLFAAQVAFASAVPLLPEEAYHWNFARHPAWGYLDHPPMVPWGIALGRLVLGDTPLGIRLVPLLWALGTAALLARLAARLFGTSAATYAVVLYALQPASFAVGGWGFPDSPLLFFWTLTLTLVWEALERGRGVWWLAAGAALGAGMLSKYTAAFLVPSVLGYLLASPRDRYWLRTAWPYLAGLVALAVFSPVLCWNQAHDWASFRFQGADRFRAVTGFSLWDGVHAAAEEWLFILPLSIPLAWVAIRHAIASGSAAERFLFWSFAPTAIFFLCMGFTPSFHVLWPLPAFLGLTVLMAGTMASGAGRLAAFYRTRWPWLVTAAGAFLLALALNVDRLVPYAGPLREAAGWSEAAARCRDLISTLPPHSFYMTVGGRPYVPTSLLAFQLDDPADVYGQNLIGWPALQYRFWADLDALAGRDAVVVVPGGDPLGGARKALAEHFRRVESAGELRVPIGPAGRSPERAVAFAFFRAWDYRPPGEPSPR